MAGTLNYLYDPNQRVHVITDVRDTENFGAKDVPAVRAGKVIRVRFAVLVTETTLFYDVQLDGRSGTTELTESDVFADLTSAVAEYETRLA